MGKSDLFSTLVGILNIVAMVVFANIEAIKNNSYLGIVVMFGFLSILCYLEFIRRGQGNG